MNFESSRDVLILSSVSRKDSGTYQCHPLKGDGVMEVKGEVELKVHCKEQLDMNGIHTYIWEESFVQMKVY